MLAHLYVDFLPYAIPLLLIIRAFYRAHQVSKARWY